VQRWVIVFLVLGCAVIGARQLAAQAQNCAGGQCIYLPAVRSAAGPAATPTETSVPPTQTPDTPTASNTPIPLGPNEDACVASGPAFADGVQVWLRDYNLFPGQSTLVCMRLSQAGNGIAGVIGRATAHYPDHDRSLGSEQTRDGGILAIPFTVEAIPAGLLVAVDAEIQWNDRLYGARTHFLSQAVPTISLVPTQVPTEAPTITATNTPVQPTLTPTSTPTLTNTPTNTPTP
jgi:hypothetical protein